MDTVKERICLHPGEKAEISRLISPEDIEAFAGLTGDDNPIHFDKEAAQISGYPERIAHGVFLNALVSTVMGTKLPGRGTVLMDQKIKYCAPVFAGSRIRIEVTFTEYEERNRHYIGVFEGVCTGEDGRVVLTAVSRQLLSKQIFYVEGQEIK